MSNDCFDGVGNAVNHDVDQEARLRRRWTSSHPSAAYFAHGIVKGDAPIAAGSDLPSENLSVKRRRLIDVDRRHLDVTDFAISKSRLLIVFHYRIPRFTQHRFMLAFAQ